MLDSEVIIRPMADGEKPAVKQVMNNAFPFLMRLFFSFTPWVLVAEKNGVIIGGVILKIFELPNSIKAGLVSLIFCVPEHAGKGTGQLLAKHGIDYLEREGCEELFACVEGDNTASSQLFRRSGFGLLSLAQQWQLYGSNVFKFWFNSLHLFDIGHFIWRKGAASPKSNSPARGRTEFVATIAIQTAIFVLAYTRIGSFTQDWLLQVGVLVLTIALLLIIRTVPMYLVARAKELQVEYRMWESGLTLSTLIALLFGGFLFAPGGLYPKSENWNASQWREPLARMAIASSLTLLSVVWSAVGLLHAKLIPTEWLAATNMFVVSGVTLLIYDLLLPLFPFSCFNAGRLWRWKKRIWSGVAVATVPLLYWLW